MNTVKVLIIIVLLAGTHFHSFSQDPHLPPGNLGITNLQDGNAPAPGWFYLQYVQAYQPDKLKGPDGNTISGAPLINSLISMQQVVYISKKQIAGGNLGFTVIVPLVKLGADGTSHLPSVNPNPLGDVIAGPLVQWFNKKLFGMDFSHRLELDFGIPTGAYAGKYDINASAHLWRIFPHYTFTLSPAKNISFSMRHHLNYYFKTIGTEDRPGITYNFNYSAEYAITRSVFVEFAGYYLTQLQQDAHNGDHHFFQTNDGITDTRERVFAYGPGVGFIFKSGLFLEVKGMQEAGAKNRTEGFRGTIALSFPLSKGR